MWCPKCGTGQCIDKVYVCENLLVPANCPGQFECGTEQCIDKVYVSDNHSQSADHSDEIGCHGHHGKGISAWLIAIFVIIIHPILLSNQSAPVAPGDFKIKSHIRRTAARHTSLLTK